MPSVAMLKILLFELLGAKAKPRKPEPDLVMDDPEKVAAYTKAGRVDGVMAPVYLHHCAQISEVIRPGDKVLDLACGPATQLAMVAQLHPNCQFTGVDLSEPMLGRAEAHIADLGLSNVGFVRSDISKLESFEDNSVDAVFSTVALHHLPDVATLKRTFEEIARVLKPGGGVYLVDFGRLKSQRTIEYFAYQYADKQAELFTLDYLYSLEAAFNKSDFESAVSGNLSTYATLYSSFLVPYNVAIKSPRRAEFDAELKLKLKALRSALPAYHKRDINDLIFSFKMSGMTSRLL
ncbi:MAG: class I SAM-dependent methyltransferase [Pseudomonadales bacterium]|nr:class I SAM-dependent methyltransferase [Pseudomonadales bacterium]